MLSDTLQFQIFAELVTIYMCVQLDNGMMMCWKIFSVLFSHSHLLIEKLLNAVRETLLVSSVFCFLSVHKAMLWHLTNFEKNI